MTQSPLFDDVYEGNVPGEPPHTVPRDVSLDASFLRFWSAYPYKTAKQAALRAWHRLAPDAAMVDLLIERLLAQRSWPQWRRGFIPYPATWLNGRRWEDAEPPATEHELRTASTYRKRVGGCMHAPVCDTYTDCLARIVRAFRERDAQ